MDSIYTTTITDAAKRRGVAVEVIEPATPIFILKHAGKSIRCYNALTDRVGAVTFHLAQDKFLANKFLAQNNLPVPRQIKYTTKPAAQEFLKQVKKIVVKPCREWGGRGVSVAIRTPEELERALRRAGVFSEDIILEEFIAGIDFRIIVVDGHFAAAIERRPATVIGNGRDTIRSLIKQANERMRHIDPSCRIPLDMETERNLEHFNLTFETVPPARQRVQVRLTTNYHTGGVVLDVTETVPANLVETAKKIAAMYGIPVMGIDFLASRSGKRFHIVELSPDLAISPPEGARVVEFFLDFLFPETK